MALSPSWDVNAWVAASWVPGAWGDFVAATVTITQDASNGVYIKDPRTGEWIHTQIVFTNETVGPQT